MEADDQVWAQNLNFYLDSVQMYKYLRWSGSGILGHMHAPFIPGIHYSEDGGPVLYYIHLDHSFIIKLRVQSSK